MIDLRKEFEELINQYGHYVLLQRTSRHIRCRCFDEVRQEGDASCRVCLGKGWISRIERHKVRYDSATQIVSRPNLNQIGPIGHSWVDARVFYFKHDVHLQVGDIIYEVGWDKKNPQKPTHLIRAFAINDVYAYRGDNGRIEYQVASVRAETVNTKIRNIVIRSLGPVKNYELVY
jgi:hypothetical protein